MKQLRDILIDAVKAGARDNSVNELPRNFYGIAEEYLERAEIESMQNGCLDPKKQKVLISVNDMPELLAKWPIEKMGQKCLMESFSALHGLIDRFVIALQKKVT
jgi:hypothetical protein